MDSSTSFLIGVVGGIIIGILAHSFIIAIVAIFGISIALDLAVGEYKDVDRKDALGFLIIFLILIVLVILWIIYTAFYY